ncbi:Serine--pyruvate aminotransferase, mitochondrial [Bagarius yarrelli]|uniref:Serine--pyruvate aminotransferase, mitochondrial n=1 Tax=Bagarius yarrelli TaxID=175774 RepID=A0A556V0C1_BAGYA|nr:Serine--pyruvate aminotransferase, mitochondrial [Bagarius yarrelli]
MLPMSSLRRGARLFTQQHLVALECCSVPCTRAAASHHHHHHHHSSLHVPPPACMLRPLEVPYRYLFGPGPSNVSPRVLSAGGRPIIGHLHPEMYEIMNDIKEGIRYAFQTNNHMTLTVLKFTRWLKLLEVISLMKKSRSQKMFNRKSKKPVSYLLDMSHLSNYWGNDGKPARMYHHTGPVSGFFTLRESLAILAEKGLENSWRQHREVAEYLWKGLEDLGLQLFIKDKDLRLPSVTTIAIPDGYD